MIGKTLFPVDGIVDLRKLITLPPGATNVQALVAIDNDFTLWVNGTQVINQIHENCAFEWNYAVSIPDNLWVSGTNLIAVQARDRGVDTGFEFDLVGPSSLVSAKPQTLVMALNSNNGQSSLTMSPSANSTQILGQPITFTALVTTTSGAPAPNIPVTFNVAGANPQQVIITTGAGGTAAFTYEGFFVGTDIVQASAQVGTTAVVSTQTQIAWTYQTNLPQLGTLVHQPKQYAEPDYRTDSDVYRGGLERFGPTCAQRYGDPDRQHRQHPANHRGHKFLGHSNVQLYRQCGRNGHRRSRCKH